MWCRRSFSLWNSYLEMKYIGKLPIEEVNCPKENLLVFMLKLLSGLFAIVVLFYLLVTLCVDTIANIIPPKTEAKLVKYIHIDVDANNIQSSKKLQNVLNRLTTCAKLPYKIDAYVLDDSRINAFAIPGGKIYVTKGLLHKVKTENALAMVLGHELGHFKHKDNLKAMGKGLIFALAGMFLSSDNYGSLFTTTLKLTNNRYSQKQILFPYKIMRPLHSNKPQSMAL